MNQGILITFLSIFFSICLGKVTDDQYGKIPVLFHNDNYDQCMLRRDALFCSFTYELSPLNSSNTTEMWQTIHELSSNQKYYRHDLLRHAVCVPETCPNINTTGDLQEEINQCYDVKFQEKQMKGRIMELKCETNKSVSPIDWVDIVVVLFFAAYLTFFSYVTFREVWGRVPTNKEVKLSTRDKVISAFSMPANWNRLMSIKSEEANQFRAIQGVRFYNQLIVIVSHTVVMFLAGPVANTKYPEGLSRKFLTLFLASGPLSVSTNFCLSTFLLTDGLYSRLEGKQLKFTTVLMIFFGRITRLLPSVAVVMLSLMTWVRHFGNGPYWNFYIFNEFRYCRKNGWSNLLFLNTVVNPQEMCMPHTWYLALDTQYFLVALVLIWIFKKYQKLMFPSLIALILISMGVVFFDHYMEDYDSLIFPYPELIYGFKNIRVVRQWYVHLLNFYGNLIPSLLGIAFGYGYNLNRKTNFLLEYKNFLSKYFYLNSFGPGLTMTLLPGFLALQLGLGHSAFWAAFYNAVARLIFTISVSGTVILSTLGYGGRFKKVVEWSPTLLLGRLSYSAYLLHFVFIMVRGAQIRFPVHLSDYLIVVTYLSDVAISYLAALIFVLVFELPLSQLQKLILPIEDKNKLKTIDTTEKETSEKIKVNGIKQE